MQNASNHVAGQRQPLFVPALTPQLPQSRQKRDTPAEPEMPNTSRLEGDRQLAVEYSAALIQSANGGTTVTIRSVPAHSTFGQWWGQLQDAFQSAEVLQWIQDKGIDTTSITLNPPSGQITFTLNHRVDPEQKVYTVGQDDYQWAAISGPILQAARVIDVGTSFAPPATEINKPVPWSIVGRFYQEPQGLTPAAKRVRAQEIGNGLSFKALDPVGFEGLIKSRSEDALEDQKAVLGEIYNRQVAASTLRHLATCVENGIEYVGQIGEKLDTTIDLSSDSAYQAATDGPRSRVSLRQYLEDHGWDIPTDHEQLVNLATALSTPAPKAATHGDLGGALTWAEPLDPANHEQMRKGISAGRFGDITLRPFYKVLDYLLNHRPISPVEQRDPRLLIDTLLNSPRGQALGKAIQASFEARSVKGSSNDWLLAALNMEIYRGAGDGVIIEDYRLMSPQNSGKSPSVIVKELTEHLVTDRAYSREVAPVQAYLMLASRAPEFLVRDIPDQVTAGSHSWVSFSTAVARLEAKAPGATATMSYAHVMLEASTAPITDDERQVEYAAQNRAIKDWGVANGMEYPSTDTAMTEVRTAYNAQVSELKQAAETQIGQMPTTNAVALQQLKKALPGIDPKLFEEKNLHLSPSSRHFPGPYSVLDLFIDGRGLGGTPNSADNWGTSGRDFVNVVTLGLATLPNDGAATQWVCSSSAINLNEVLTKLKDLPRPQAPFEEAFAQYADAVKKITAAQIKSLIAKQSPEDRLNLECGQIVIRKEIEYYRASHPLRVAEGVLLVETERNGKRVTYEFNRLKGTLLKLPDKAYAEYPPRDRTIPTKGKRYDLVESAGQYSPAITNERKGAQRATNSFGSERTRYIADALIADMDLPGVQRSAKGVTTFETEVPTYKIVEEIALSLIPLRSAIKHFVAGNIVDGVVDLAFDIFGFAVGVGAAAKGAKGLFAGASALSKLGQGVKIVGRAAVGALNPLGGVDDLARGIFNGVRTGAVGAYKGVKQLRGSYRNVNLLELAKKPDIAEGTFRAANSTHSGKALAKFDEATSKWYAVDPRTKQAYGKPLENFAAAPHTSSDPNSLQAIGSSDAVKAASQRHGLAATGTFKVGQETVDGNVVMFQGNWHQYDALKKRAFGPPVKDFTPRRIAAGGEVRPLNTDLTGYDAKYLAPHELATQGLQGNVYAGPSKKEYIKVDGTLYESRLKEGQRVIRHPAGSGPDIPVSDLGVKGWEPTASAGRLLGGAGGTPTRWRLNDSTYVVPMDDIKVVENSASPFRLTYEGTEHDVAFSSTAGAWRDTISQTGVDLQKPMYYWRSGKGKWQRGPIDKFISAKKSDAHTYTFVDVTSAVSLKVPKDLKPLPKELHYFWAGQEIPSHLVDNIATNASRAPGYTSIIHVDADTPAIFQQIKTQLQSKAPGLTVVNLHEDEVFKQLKQGEMYDYFRQGQGKNLAAASDVARYPIMNKQGGIYLDTDDVIQGTPGTTALQAGANDVLLGAPVEHNLTDYKTFYNTSNFATQPGNPVIEEVITEMNKRFAANKPYFEANRPTVTRGADGRVNYTPAFEAYERKIFDTVGPNLFNDALKSKRPDMYDLGLDGSVRQGKVVDGVLVASGPVVDVVNDLRQLYASRGVVAPELLGNQLKNVKEHYFPLRYRFRIQVGADHSWIGT